MLCCGRLHFIGRVLKPPVDRRAPYPLRRHRRRWLEPWSGEGIWVLMRFVHFGGHPVDNGSGRIRFQSHDNIQRSAESNREACGSVS